MVRRANECARELRTNMRGGEGTVLATSFVSEEELRGMGRIFSLLTINPHSSIGFHVHDGDTEFFFVRKGELVYDDNGAETTVREGDVMITPKGTGHAVRNETDEPGEIVALIINA
ncbi:MAG: cupin domain-containing protein [Oscillospiraceae bacterium]|nr:cupin domain-containing protein [Oscillospiraceae bacterium]